MEREPFPNDYVLGRMREMADETPVNYKEILKFVSSELAARAIKEAWINEVDEEYNE